MKVQSWLGTGIKGLIAVIVLASTNIEYKAPEAQAIEDRIICRELVVTDGESQHTITLKDGNIIITRRGKIHTVISPDSIDLNVDKKSLMITAHTLAFIDDHDIGNAFDPSKTVIGIKNDKGNGVIIVKLDGTFRNLVR